jgi:hypothetical protein
MTDPAIPTTSPTTVRNANFWLYELPFALVLVLTVFGVAYTTFSRQPIKGYWEVLVPFIVLVCISAGWQNASDRADRWRLSHNASPTLARIRRCHKHAPAADRAEEFQR